MTSRSTACTFLATALALGPRMRESLRATMRPGALLVAIEIGPQKSWDPLPGVPERDGHGISVEDLIEELTSDGFVVLERFDDWEGDDDHCGVIFRQSAEETSVGTRRSPGPSSR